MLDVLRGLEPDYLVLGGLGILGAEALAIPRRGTFNVHPGLLPWIRGVSVIERAIERGVPVGITAHYVDPGIDTGSIIRRELIPVRPHDTMASLRRVAYERCAQVMVELVTEAARGRHPEATSQQGRFSYCTAMSDADCARLDASVRSGLALRLYREWLGFFGSHVLPPGEDRPPAEGEKAEAESVVAGSGAEPVRMAE
jgi:methionyl-tRNA formyltransferase